MIYVLGYIAVMLTIIVVIGSRRTRNDLPSASDHLHPRITALETELEATRLRHNNLLDVVEQRHASVMQKITRERRGSAQGDIWEKLLEGAADPGNQAGVASVPAVSAPSNGHPRVVKRGAR